LLRDVLKVAGNHDWHWWLVGSSRVGTAIAEKGDEPMLRQITAVFTSLIVASGMSYGAMVNFDDPALLGKLYGAPAGDAPGDIVHAEEGITMATVGFSAPGPFFNQARIVEPPVSFFDPAINPTQTLNVNNIGLRFDFTALGDVRKVSFDYAELGGTNNFEINSTGLQLFADFPALGSPAGFNVQVFPITADEGRVAIEAVGADPIRFLRLGGQELSLDNVTAVPEPTGAVLAGLAFLFLGRRR
jgi:hypothetical protein